MATGSSAGPSTLPGLDPLSRCRRRHVRHAVEAGRGSAAEAGSGWGGSSGGRRFLREYGGGHLGLRQPRGGGHVRELAGGLGQRQAVPLHEHAPGGGDDHGRLAVGPGPGKLAPLPLNDRGQPRHVLAVCHKHRLRYG